MNRKIKFDIEEVICMKKIRIIMLAGMVLLVNIVNVSGKSFSIENTGVSAFDLFGNSEITKYEIDEKIGNSDKTEKLFHAIYNCTIDGVKGELKVRYNDRPEAILMDKITNNINDNILVGRILWKEKGYSEKKYDYQILDLDKIDYNTNFEDTLKKFNEIPVEIDDIKNNTIQVYYGNYPMYNEYGTLILMFENNCLERKSCWMFKIPEEKRFSDYSLLICECWLRNLRGLLDYMETIDVETTYDKIYLSSFRKLNDYYLKVFKEKSEKEMKIFDWALRNYYLDLCVGKRSKFIDNINKWKENLKLKSETIDINKATQDFVKIWKNTDESKFSWDEILEMDKSPYHSVLRGQPIQFYDKIMDENNENVYVKMIMVSYDPENPNIIF